jgi:hypothetical protein
VDTCSNSDGECGCWTRSIDANGQFSSVQTRRSDLSLLDPFGGFDQWSDCNVNGWAVPCVCLILGSLAVIPVPKTEQCPYDHRCQRYKNVAALCGALLLKLDAMDVERGREMDAPET